MFALQRDYSPFCYGDYHINIFYSEADEGYIADLPDVEACSAFGKTPPEALKQAEFAKKAWLEAARAEGQASLSLAIGFQSN